MNDINILKVDEVAVQWLIKEFKDIKVVLHRSHGNFFAVKVKTVKLIGGRRCLPKSYRRCHSLRSWISGDLGDPWRTTLRPPTPTFTARFIYVLKRNMSYLMVLRLPYSYAIKSDPP